MVVRLLLLGLALALAMPTQTEAANGVLGNYIGCSTKEQLSQLSTGISNKDQRLLDSMIGKVCALVNGHEFSILKRGVLISKVRVYTAKGNVDLWVHSEAIR